MFKLPEPYIPKVGARIMSLANPEAKMSKSENDDPGRVCLMDKPEDIMRLFKRAITDCDSEVRYDPENKKGVSNLMTHLFRCDRADASPRSRRNLQGAATATSRQRSARPSWSCCAPSARRATRLLADKAYLQSVCESGAQKAAWCCGKNAAQGL